jgi:hypothetical protein
MGHRSVEPDLSWRTWDGVGHSAIAVADVGHVHLLAGKQVGLTHQILRNAARPLVVEVDSSDGGAVNLRFQDDAEHVVDPFPT